MIYVFHHNDIDGVASAYLVKAANPGKNIMFVSCNYTFPLNPDAYHISAADTVYIVDYSFKEVTLSELNALRSACNNVIWIDHHYCSLALTEEYPELKSISGIVSSEHSAAVLTWLWFNPDQDMIPRWLQLVSDYDTWKKELEDTDAFNFGLLSMDWDIHSDVWPSLYKDDFLYTVIIKGQAVLDYIRIANKKHLEEYGFITEFCGHECLAVNSRYQYSMIFEGVRDKVCVMFQYTGSCWKYSVFSDGKVNASELAAQYGGGGHHGAAGFTTKELLPCFCKSDK